MCGVNDDSMQWRLLADNGLMIVTALKKAQAIETAKKGYAQRERKSSEYYCFQGGH